MWRSLALALLSVVTLNVPSTSAEDADSPKPAEARSAVEKALPLLEKCSAGSVKQRKCFTCHNQALPVFALTQAKKQGFAVDEENLKRQIEHTLAHLKRGKKGYLAGKGQGGQVGHCGLRALDARSG